MDLYFKAEKSGGGATAFYEESIWTSFQGSQKTMTIVGIGSNTATAVGFKIDKPTRIKSAAFEITSFIAGGGQFAIHNVESGLVTDALYNSGSYTISANGIYTFTAINLDLQPGIYAYIIQQNVIQTYRAISLPDNIFGLLPTMGASAFISAKRSTQVGIPDPFPVGQTNYTGNVPLAIFEIEMI